MTRIAVWAIAACAAVCGMAACAGADEQAADELSASQVVDKNVVARGGADAWRKIDSMVWVGHVDNGSAPARFVLAMKRPNKTRFEIVSLDRVALRVYDGTHGWKLRPMRRDTTPNLQPYTAEELKFARDEQVIDGVLIDHEAKGIGVMLDGVDEVEGHKAYRLDVKLPSGSVRRVWIDASSFLELKYERDSRTTLGQPVKITVYYRDYRAVDGVKMPFTIESAAAAAPVMDKVVIDKVSLNPSLDDKLFARPLVPERGNSVIARPDGGASAATRGPGMPGVRPAPSAAPVPAK